MMLYTKSIRQNLHKLSILVSSFNEWTKDVSYSDGNGLQHTTEQKCD